MKHPSEQARETVLKLMARGLAQGHQPDGWKTDGRRLHVLKAIRHLTNYLMTLEGYREPTEENEAANALCRIAFVITLDEGE